VCACGSVIEHLGKCIAFTIEKVFVHLNIDTTHLSVWLELQDVTHYYLWLLRKRYYYFII